MNTLVTAQDRTSPPPCHGHDLLAQRMGHSHASLSSEQEAFLRDRCNTRFEGP